MTKTKDGNKYYPVGKFIKNQHIFVNYNDKCYIDMVASEYDANKCDRFEYSEHLLEVIQNNTDENGMIYATYRDYKNMKDIIGFYNIRHGF